MDVLVNEYKMGYARLRDEIEGLSEEEMTFKPSKDSWSIREIVIHIVDAEMVHIHRMKAVISEENPLLTAFNQDAWSERLKYSSQNQHVYLSLFQCLRESFIPVVQNLNPEDYQRIGTHNVAGKVTLEEILIHSIDHVTGHIEQIRRVKAAMSEKLN